MQPPPVEPWAIAPARRASHWKRNFAVLALVVIAGAISLALFATSGPADAVERHLSLLAKGDLQTAYAGTDPRFQQQVSFAAFTQLIERYPILTRGTASWTSRSVNGDEAVVRGALTAADQTRADVEFHLAKGSDGAWRIMGFGVTPVSSGGAAPALTAVPPPTAPPQPATRTAAPVPQATATGATAATAAAQPPSATTRPSAPATPAPATPAPATQAPPSAPRGRPIAFFAASGKEPAAVTIDWNAAMAGSYPSEHVYYRLRTLRELSAAAGPGGGYVNVFRSIAPQSYSVRTDAEAAPGAVFLDFTVTSSGWGVSADQVKLLLQQLVYTATEEPDIDHVRITQNGGRPAVIAGATVASDLTREGVR